MKKLILIILLMSTICYGSNEIRGYYPSGSTCYSVIRNSTGQAWDTAGNAFEAWNVMTDYDITLTDKSGGMYLGTFDADVSAGFYTIIIYKQLGGSPADSDLPLLFEEGYWDGSIWKSTTKRLDDIITDTNEIPTAEEIRIEIDTNSTQLAAILEDTGTTLPELIADVNTNLETAIGNITVDNNAIALAVRIEMDANSTDFNTIIVDTGTTLPALIGDVNDNIIAQFAAIDVNETDIAEAVWDAVVEGGYTYQDYMRVMAAVLFGKSTGGGTTNIKFYDVPTGLIDRINETVTAMGNRTAVTVDPND